MEPFSFRLLGKCAEGADCDSHFAAPPPDWAGLALLFLARVVDVLPFRLLRWLVALCSFLPGKNGSGELRAFWSGPAVFPRNELRAVRFFPFRTVPFAVRVHFSYRLCTHGAAAARGNKTFLKEARLDRIKTLLLLFLLFLFALRTHAPAFSKGVFNPPPQSTIISLAAEMSGASLSLQFEQPDYFLCSCYFIGPLVVPEAHHAREAECVAGPPH